MPQTLQTGTVLDGLYRLDRLLGSGGVGAVYEAYHLNLNQHLAVKVLHPQFSQYPDALERFQREARFLSQLGHQSFVTVYDFGYADDGTPYLVMELIKGETLRTRLLRGPLSISEVLALFAPLCEALTQAHNRQIIHRDLKPDNLMLVEGGVVKILDFGMAKLMSDEIPLTMEKVVMGTPYYMAPERARGKKDVDHRSDIFSLGAILYEVLTGKMAFEADDPRAAMYRVIEADVPPLGLADEELSQRLDDVLAKTCAKDARERFHSAAEMWTALEAATQRSACSPLMTPLTQGATPSSSPPHLKQAATQRRNVPTVKAGVIQALFEFIRNKFGETGVHALCAEFGPSRVEKIFAHLPTDRMDMSVLNDLHDTANKLFDDGSLNLMRDLGRHFADIALSTLYSSFITQSGPESLARRVQIIHKMIADEGESKVSQIDGNTLLIQITGVSGMTPSMAAATAGWYNRYMELSGATVTSMNYVLRTDNGNPLVEIIFQFRSDVSL